MSNDLKTWINSAKRIPLSYMDPKIFCVFSGVCITLKVKTFKNCKICLDHERNGTRNRHKEFLEGMYKE